jgi:hypothetical protein
MAILMEVIGDDFLVFAELFLDFVDDKIDRRAKIIGLGLSEVVHIVAGEMAVCRAKLSLGAEMPYDGDFAPEVLFESFRLLLGIRANGVAGAHLLEAYSKCHRYLLLLVSGQHFLFGSNRRKNDSLNKATS